MQYDTGYIHLPYTSAFNGEYICWNNICVMLKVLQLPFFCSCSSFMFATFAFSNCNCISFLFPDNLSAPVRIHWLVFIVKLTLKLLSLSLFVFERPTNKTNGKICGHCISLTAVRFFTLSSACTTTEQLCTWLHIQTKNKKRRVRKATSKETKYGQ